MPKVITDHKGNVYKTTTAMCNEYGISFDTYKMRIGKGLSVEEALTKPIKHYKRRNANDDKFAVSVDHLGNKFDTQRDMCRHYKIAYNTFRSRLYRGWSVEAALTGELRNYDVAFKESIQEDEISEKVEDVKEEINIDKGDSDKSVPVYDSDKTILKCLKLIGLLRLKGVTITASNIEKMFSDKECEEYRYLQILLS